MDIVLGPEMKSTGEVMGVSDKLSIAFAKSQLAAGTVLPMSGQIFISVADRAKVNVAELAKKLVAMGYDLIATKGTAERLIEAGVKVQTIKEIEEGHPNAIDMMIDGTLKLVFNTPRAGRTHRRGPDPAASVMHGIPCITTLQAAEAAARPCSVRETEMEVQAVRPLPAVCRGKKRRS